MLRYKAARNCEFKPWLTAKPGKTGSGRFNQIDNSWYLSKAVCALSGNAYKLYHSMAIESGGKPFVEFSHKTAAKYGIAKNTFDRARDELVKSGFIEMRPDENMYRYRSNIYRFIEAWKMDGDQISIPQNGDT